MADLRVEMHGELLGHLVGTGALFDFVASRDAVRRHGLGSAMLSLAVPLVPRAPVQSRQLRRNFFSELLAEGDARHRLAEQARVQRGDVIGMLRAYGRDVAGALQIWDPDDPDEPRHSGIEPLDGRGVERMLLDVAVSPLGNTPPGGKTSLNGVQGKIVLVHTADGWARAVGGHPSTHIVKPVAPRHPTMIFDEEYGSRFTRALGLADFDTHLDRFGDVTALVITRYDRDPNSVDGRIHQEDFNQVLGLSDDQKYETYGGKGLRDIAQALTDDDRQRLLKMVTLSRRCMTLCPNRTRRTTQRRPSRSVASPNIDESPVSTWSQRVDRGASGTRVPSWMPLSPRCNGSPRGRSRSPARTPRCGRTSSGSPRT